jgi:hypothetical protein
MSRVGVASALGLLALAQLSCGDPITDHDRLDRSDSNIVSVNVHVTNGNAGTLANPNPYTGDPVTFQVAIDVRDGAPEGGNLIDTFDGWVNVSVTPGVLVELSGANGTEVAGRSVHLTAGQGSVNVTFRRAYGEMRIWVEENGYIPADLSSGTVPQCANGMDDDGDGRTDFPGDYGCAAPNDDSEVGGSYALGSSEPIYFASPRIYDVQGGGSQSPLVNERVGINGGRLIVTRISVEGFWVTDIDDRSCPDPANPTDPSRNHACYNSIFAFNFRLPDGLRPCDQLELLQGSVQEFVSTTQLGQPAWRIPPENLWVDEAHSGTCPIPDAVEITPAMLNAADTQLEPYESGVVRASGLVFPTLIGPERPCTTANGVTTCNFAPGASNCDLNGDGRVDFNNPAEATCGNGCQGMRGCSEWTGWARFGTMQVDYIDPTAVNPRLEVSPREAMPDLDPNMLPAVGSAGFTITGTLKQVGPNWIVEPRCTQDLVLDVGIGGGACTDSSMCPNGFVCASDTHTCTLGRANQTCLLPRAAEDNGESMN